ncbi:glutamine--fructose-6-phosphate transaminase (isomerizing) [Dehalogenimonas formicexedens]|uniref:Glutamine--fructose-6-phosphate aminotransferase [isomerizing] n=1 Tax=Dehalogenimonas formicexedens TaxID=1839801 RepID=A0A1P8F766_9CHLR|nr:glutamine--fructose-6-phosphate transaminase (isomerizing) [Dehalogenimonas formicexedens]APV44275.1 glutamine--fructose-6-phosphate transaminase (isomerizing) [Dehalogenimonas formicexedens]
MTFMCGIAGYIGIKPAKEILLDSLSRLEYRGYDSCGIAVRGSPLTIFKGTSRVGHLRLQSPELGGTIGIGHTRWATHGEVSAANAHPHTDCHHKIAVVHNGIISNYRELRKLLKDEGHTFRSETDSEVLPHLVEKFYRGDIESALRQALGLIEGTYAVLAVTEHEDRVVAARNGSPLVVGVCSDGFIFASDVLGIGAQAESIVYLEDGDIAICDKRQIKITNEGKTVQRIPSSVHLNALMIEKGGFEHYMLKEINEQPEVVRACLRAYSDPPRFRNQLIFDSTTDSLTLTACGTSYHAAEVGKFIIEELTGIPVRLEIASEIRHRPTIIKTAKAIGLSQSGETADVLTSLKRMKEAGIETIALTNVFQSSISRIADDTIYIPAGPEVAVAATKTFVAQIIALIKLALAHQSVDRTMRDQINLELERIPHKIQQILDNRHLIKQATSLVAAADQVFFIAKGVNVPIALEGALKAKEIAYINAEGFCAGELKHGPFALLSPSSTVIAIIAGDENQASITASVREIQARKSKVVCITRENDSTFNDSTDNILRIPSTHRLLSPILNAVVVQLLAYYTAEARGCPIDFPRNLAKSVTVE